MARASILSDEFVRQLVAVGQVDILVGVPTYNHASTIQGVVQSVHAGLARHFPRERTVLINADGGSDDGTSDLVRTARLAEEELAGTPSLRTTHRVITRYSGLPDHSAGVRMVFAAADLLQARAVVLVDPAATNPHPDWVPSLARPVWNGTADFIIPLRPRRRLDGALLSQLVQPLIGAAYGRQCSSGLAGDLACSGVFAARMVGHPMWEHDPSPLECDVWLLTTAMAEQARLGILRLGERSLALRPGAPSLPAIFGQVVGTMFSCLEQHAPEWQLLAEREDVPVYGESFPGPSDAAPLELAPLVERFRAGVRDLDPLLHEILAPRTRAGLQAAAVAGRVHRLDDTLWASTVYDFVAAAHHDIMQREHLAQALLPLYLGRTASIANELAETGEPGYSQRMLALGHEFTRMRPYLLERWKNAGWR